MIWMVVILYFALMLIVSGWVFLKFSYRSEGFYSHYFRWLVSPLFVLAGLIFIGSGHKRSYFYRLLRGLMINDKKR
jgi:hypothetical protein